MKIVSLSAASIIGCLLGLAALIGVGLYSLDRMQTREADLAELRELRMRADTLSVASDSMLLFTPDPALWDAYVADARGLQSRLGRYADDHPQARRAAHHIDMLLETIEPLVRTDAVAPDESRPAAPPAGDSPGGAPPLDIPVRSRIIMNQVAAHGIALDHALDQMLSERRQAIAREAYWIGGSFAAAAFVFATLCLVAFGLMHWRISGPVRALTAAIDRIRAGERQARVGSRAGDEFGRLARTFDQLQDEREEAFSRLAEQRAELERRERMLAESQRIARLGSWRLDLSRQTLEWSDECYRIHGVAPEHFEPTPEAFLEFVHPDDSDRLLAHKRPILRTGEPRDIEYRIVRHDGEVRHVHDRAEAELDSSGRVVAVSGTTQDITERRQLDERLHQYQQLVEGSNEPLAVIGPDYRYVLANHAYADRYGFAGQNLEGAHVREIIGQDYFENCARARIDQAFGGEAQIYEAERNYPHLGTRQLLVRLFPFTSPDGHGRQVASIVTDVTPFKAAEAELRRQAHLLDIAGRVARLGGWSVDLAADRITWSDAVAEIHGMPLGHSPTVDEGIGFYAPEYRERIRTLFTACVEQAAPFDEELQIVTGRGERVWVRAIGEPVRGEDGHIAGVQGAFQDISARKAADEEIERLAQRLVTVLESITDAFFTLDREWRFTYVNAETERLVERSRDELMHGNLWREFPDVIGTPFEEACRRSMAEGTPAAMQDYYRPLGKWLDLRIYPSAEGLAVFFRDITADKRIEETLRERTEALAERVKELRCLQRITQILDQEKRPLEGLLSEVVAVIPQGWRYPDDTSAVIELSGREFATPDRQVAGWTLTEEIRVSGVAAGTITVAQLEGPSSPDGTEAFLAEERGLLRLIADKLGHVIERRRTQDELERMAYEDTLTGLYTRKGVVHALDARFDRARWPADAVIVMLDVRGLHRINDVHGYEAGDSFLVQVSQRLSACAGEGAILGRVGGDEFVVFLPRSPDSAAARLAAVFDEPFTVSGVTIETGARFGCTRFGATPRVAENLLREAEVALFDNRREDVAGNWTEYTAELDEQTRHRHRVTEELREALASDQFLLHFQPRVMLATGELTGAEALLRWQHPERGLQPPDTFIPIAEQSQLIAPIGDWVIEEACRSLRAWQDDGLEVVRVAVNVSLVQFAVGDLTETIRAAIARHGIRPEALTLEITESVFEREAGKLREQLQALHEMGVRLALDDFGTGYSSLLYLQQYPFDEIKIDKGFVNQMLDDPYSRKLVATVISIADAMNAEAVAEGVENEAVRDELMAMGALQGQGYQFSMPLASEDFRWILEQKFRLPLAPAD